MVFNIDVGQEVTACDNLPHIVFIQIECVIFEIRKKFTENNFVPYKQYIFKSRNITNEQNSPNITSLQEKL